MMGALEAWHEVTGHHARRRRELAWSPNWRYRGRLLLPEPRRAFCACGVELRSEDGSAGTEAEVGLVTLLGGMLAAAGILLALLTGCTAYGARRALESTYVWAAQNDGGGGRALASDGDGTKAGVLLDGDSTQMGVGMRVGALLEREPRPQGRDVEAAYAALLDSEREARDAREEAVRERQARLEAERDLAREREAAAKKPETGAGGEGAGGKGGSPEDESSWYNRPEVMAAIAGIAAMIGSIVSKLTTGQWVPPALKSTEPPGGGEKAKGS